MTDYPYAGILLADAVTFQRAPNAVVTVYNIDDATNSTPLGLTDLTGLPLPQPLTSSSDAFLPPFVAQVDGVKLVGGGLTIVEYSHKGMKDAADAAAAAAQAAAQDAGIAAAEEFREHLGRGTLPNGADFNTYYAAQHVGTYTVTLAGAYVNGPTNISASGTFEVVRASGSTLAVTQRVTVGTTMAWREAVDSALGTWGAWAHVETVAQSDAKLLAAKTLADATFLPISRGVLADGTDLNTLTGQQHAGVYAIGSSGYSNAPVTTSTGVLEVLRGVGSSLSLVQRVTAGAAVWWREVVDIGAGTWSEWNQVETSALAAAAFETKTDANAKLVEAKAYTDTEVGEDRVRLDAVETKNTQQDADIVNATWNKGVSTADLNTLQTSGRYWFNITSATNQPLAATGSLEVFWGTTTGIQVYTTRELVPRIYYRHYSGGWGAWIQNTIVTIVSTADLNTLQSSGRYWFNVTNAANQPIAATGSLDVLWGSTTGVQVYTTRETVPRIYYRHYSGSWGTWKESISGTAVKPITLADTDTIDTLIGSFYRVSTGATATTLGLPSALPGFLTVLHHTTVRVQVWETVTTTDPARWVRVMNANVWGSWYRTDGLKALVDAKAYTDAKVGPIQPIKAVKLEAGQWVWDLANATHYLLPDHTGALIARPTPFPVPDATPSLTW